LAAVAQDGEMLEYTDLHLRCDRDVVLTAVAQNAKALKFADTNLKSDSEFIAAAKAVGYSLS